MIQFQWICLDLPQFLDRSKDNPLKSEYYIPTVVFEEISKGNITVEVLKTSAVWQGITYKEDKDKVVKEIKALVDNGVYEPGLWK